MESKRVIAARKRRLWLGWLLFALLFSAGVVAWQSAVGDDDPSGVAQHQRRLDSRSR